MGVDGHGPRKGPPRLDDIQLNASTPIGQFGAKNYEAATAIIVPRYMGQSGECVLRSVFMINSGLFIGWPVAMAIGSQCFGHQGYL